jgi:hypothetical protein
MAYKKIMVDNTTCLRRFHISFDDNSPKEKIQLKCFYCDAVVFSSDSHPRASIVRDEILVNTNYMSPCRVKKCYFKDKHRPQDSNK